MEFGSGRLSTLEAGVSGCPTLLQRLSDTGDPPDPCIAMGKRCRTTAHVNSLCFGDFAASACFLQLKRRKGLHIRQARWNRRHSGR